MDLISDHPFWPLNSGLIRSYPSLKTNLKCEVLVLGAGITGALCAYHLAKAGVDVAVLDKRDVASGSTSASTAMLQYEIDTPLTELIERMGKADAERAYQVCLESIGKIATLCDEIGDPCGFTWKSSVYLASRQKDVPDLQAEYAARRAAGIELDFLSQADVEARFSFSRPAALLSMVAAEVDVYRLTHRLLQRAQEMGSRIFDRTAMKSYKVSPKGVTATTETVETVRAKWIVFATGYEVVELLKRDIVNLNSSFAFVSEPIEAFTGWWETCLLWETARPYFYMRTTVDGRAIVGGEDANYRDPIRRDASVRKKAAKLEKRFREMFPAIDFDPAYAWAGTFGETKDGLAYIGSVPELPRCFFTLGFGSNGISYSVIAAEIVRDAIQGKKHPDARLFRFDR
ncbi:FAD-dependent oxidoreductase [Pelagicoccus sp. SDUM812003]|uniref:NAD(P)/FAD-dependent oxidoreductase n=1 Tax=Pelagicoccus sp. SDUM812003 TaxID=3041267 RepID=UPI00280D39D2|nr:FAD-dependent oxidoreductase [Pelagicoccus sp. SDUM812003]MDQ8204733.1 FAD-dependent oxidoreductase [Pelagicoccus sp. SDUM812003]